MEKARTASVAKVTKVPKAAAMLRFRDRERGRPPVRLGLAVRGPVHRSPLAPRLHELDHLVGRLDFVGVRELLEEVGELVGVFHDFRPLVVVGGEVVLHALVELVADA